MSRRPLPTGIQSFRRLRERNCYYVDKTDYALRMVEDGTHYFLSRPRRFGKSLFLDTLKELFSGSKELFHGLYAYDRWDWSARHPVIRLSFGRGNFKVPGYLSTNLKAQFRAIEGAYGVEPLDESAPERLDYLIRTLHLRTGKRVVMLVDEYDKPILDALKVPDVARDNRDFLRGLYATIKDCDDHVHFCFLTGVSKFSKVSLFSGLNNLIDITLEPAYSAVCGYTDSDLDTVFAPELPGLDRQQIRDWYNGYGWGGEERVYNPFDALLLFRTREFDAWWFETGTPTFLVRTLVDRRIATSELETMVASRKLLGTFDVGRIATEALLFQSGYLTIVGEEREAGRKYYRLGYPNLEVRQSLNECLADSLVGDASVREKHSKRLARALLDADFERLEKLFRKHFASIPYEWHSRNDIAEYEGYYASVFYSYFAGLELQVILEDSSSTGRVDMVVRVGGRVFLFEFKVVERSGRGAAMEQLKQRGYADKYRHAGEPVHLVAVEFSAEKRSVERFDMELA